MHTEDMHENQPAEDRLADDRFAEDRVADDRLAEDRVPEDRVPDDRLGDNRLSEDRVAEDRGTDDRFGDERKSPGNGQQAPVDTQEAPLELFGREEVTRFRTEWSEVQARFVDDPQEAVRGADQLVTEVMGSLATTFTNHKHELEGQWQHGSDAQTEDLRQALRRYRVFFNQLLDA